MLEPIAAGRLTLVDTIDHLLNKGAVLHGDATLSIAGVDLIYVGLNLLVSSVETMRQHGDWPGPAPLPAARSGAAPAEPGALAAQPSSQYLASPSVAINSPRTTATSAYELVGLGKQPEVDTGERSLARLVLALVELLRQLVERQALRRLEGSGLTDEQIEQMGRSLMELSAKMAQLREAFGLDEADLAIDLGPLGRLLQ